MFLEATVNMDTDEAPVFTEREHDSMTVHFKGRYVGWVQRARSMGGVLLEGWQCNWRNDDGTWNSPYTEEPGHLHPTQRAAISYVVDRTIRER